MLWFLIGFFCLAIDQLSKFYIANNFAVGQTVPFINRVFHITYHLNTGAAFSLFRGATVFLTIATALIIIGLLAYVYIKRPQNILELASFTLIISGALGNLIDRIFRGAVVDFLDFRLINFPVFNVADCFVVIGGILLFVYVLKYVKD